MVEIMMPLLPPFSGQARMRGLRPFCAAVLFTVVTALAPSAVTRAGEPLLPPAGDAVADEPENPKPPPPFPLDNPAIQARPPGCAVWTDSCVTCEYLAADRIACSNIGIACQPHAVRCMRTDPADDKKPHGNKKDN